MRVRREQADEARLAIRLLIDEGLDLSLADVCALRLAARILEVLLQGDVVVFTEEQRHERF